MSDALQNITDFINQLTAVPEIIAEIVGIMPGWFSVALGMSIVLGLIVLIIKIVVG